MKHSLINPVILSGGSGSRLWPLSRAGFPKQFLTLHGQHTMLQATALRVSGDGFARPLMICNDDHRFIVSEQLRAVNVKPDRIILEPIGRNTAPAVAVAALALLQQQDDALMLVMPSDHVITDGLAFLSAVEKAKAAALAGKLVTFGIEPSSPETGYGYIQKGEAMADVPGANAVLRFVEKPDEATALAYLNSGEYAWNSGLFLFSAKRFLAELTQHNPQMISACAEALAQAELDLNFCRLNKEAFSQCPADSIDYAVMEKTTDAAVVPVSMGWSDLGAWQALWEVEPKDAHGNASKGEVVMHNTRNSYVYTDHPLVAVTGLDNIVVIATDDAILVADKNNTQDVKYIVDQLKAEGRHEHIFHTTVHRPWGSYRGIDQGERYQVKRITVKPGEKLSLQMHHHRAEHWIVVSGTALITNGDKTFLLHENESTYIPIGETHRLENPGKVPLHLIEVQSGSYLGEDDIVRFEDGYGRADATVPDGQPPRQLHSEHEHATSASGRTGLADEVEQENEILREHLSQVQEELEHYFKGYQASKKEIAELQNTQQENIELRHELAEVSSQCAALQDKLSRLYRQKNQHFRVAQVVPAAKNDLHFQLVDGHLAGQVVPHAQIEMRTSLTKTELFVQVGDEEARWSFSTQSQAESLDNTRWAQAMELPAVLHTALMLSALRSKEKLLGYQALEKLQSHVNSWPTRLLYNQVRLTHEQVNEDYEHLWLTLEQPGFKERYMRRWSFRIGCAGVTPLVFGEQPKLELPEQDTQLLESWFTGSQDPFGNKLELRFALPEAMDKDVWGRLSADDQAMLYSLVKQLPDMLKHLQSEGVELSRDWAAWRRLATDMQRILFSNIGRF